MAQYNAIQLFETKKVRTIWDGKEKKWYFSIVDTTAVLTNSIDATAYWHKLKQRLKAEENETVTVCHGLQMLAADRKMRLTKQKNNTQTNLYHENNIAYRMDGRRHLQRIHLQ